MRISDWSSDVWLFRSELNRRLQAAEMPVTTVGCHPGFARTNFGRASLAGRLAVGVGGLLFNTPAMGAWPTLQAATGNVKPGGSYGPTAFAELRGPSFECRSEARRVGNEWVTTCRSRGAP